MKKGIALLLAAVMLLTLIALPAAAEETKTLTVWTAENLRIEDWNTNEMTLWLEEKLGCNLEIIPLTASADYNTKVNMALTAGKVKDLPDVIIGAFSDANVWEWAQAETILPLTAYYADPALAVEINIAKERTGVDYPKQITSPDGNIYSVAMLNQSYSNEYPAKMWYSSSWLEALGATVPTTTDEFCALLRRVHETDLNGNGKNDEIGLAGTFGTVAGFNYTYWFEYLMNAFVYAGDTQYRTVTDGTVALAYTTDAWKEGLKYIRQMFAEGLIAPETLTMSVDQFRALMNNEDMVVFSLNYFAPDMLDAGGDRALEYVYGEPLTGPAGLKYATYEPSVANPRFLVTANCSDPELAFKLGDLMSSEYIGISQRWGSEGKDWDYIANVPNAENYVANVSSFPVCFVAYHDNLFWGGSEVTNQSWRQTGPFVRQYGIYCGMGIDPATTDEYTIRNGLACTLYQEGGYHPAQVIPKLILTTEESDQVSEIESNLKSFVDEMTAAFLSGNADIDGEWDAFQKQLEEMQAQEYLAVIQNVYDRMYR